MAFLIPGKDFVIGVTKEDIENYTRGCRDGSITDSFIKYIKKEMELPYYQEVIVEAEYTSKEACKSESSSYINLTDVDISGGDFSSTDYPECPRSKMIFRNVKFPGRRNLMKATHIERSSIEGKDYRRTQNLLGPLLTMEEWVHPDRGLNETLKDQERQRHIIKTYTPDSSHIKNTIAAHNSTLWTITELGKYFLKTMSPTYNMDDVLNMDSVFDVYRFDSIEKGNEHRLAAVEKIASDHIDKVITMSLDKTKARGWFGRDITDAKSKKINGYIKQILLTQLKEDDFLRKQFLMHKDTKALQDFLDKNIPTWQKSIKEAGKSSAPTDEEIIESLTGSIKSTVKEWKQSRIETGGRWTALESYGSRDRSRWKGSKKSVEISLPGGLSDISAWPNIPPENKKAREEDLKLKKEGLRLLLAGGTAALSGIGITSTWLGAVSPTTGVAAVVASIAGGVAADQIISRHMTMDNYDSFNNKFGDLLLELGTTKRACEQSAYFVANNAITASVLNQFTDSKLALGAKSLLNPVRAFGKFALASNLASTYAFIQKEKRKSIKSRRRPGDPSFQNSLDEKLIHIPKMLTYGALSAAIVGGVILAAVFAGPALGPAMAAVGALSPTALVAIGTAATTVLAGIGYKVTSKLSYYFGKAKHASTRTQPAITPAPVATETPTTQQTREQRQPARGERRNIDRHHAQRLQARPHETRGRDTSG